MLIRTAAGKTPAIAPTARAAESAALIGDVTLGENVTVWYGAVLRGDVGPIRIGPGSNIQDNCTLHCSAGVPTQVGENVVVGHGAVLHSCVVEDGCLIGMGAVVLDNSVVGAGSIVGAGALVPPGKRIPPGSVVMGTPGRVVRPATEEEMGETLENARHYAALGREQLERTAEKSGG